MTDVRNYRVMFYIGLVAALFWGFGTNLLDRRWYFVHGVSVGDIVFIGWTAWALTRRDVASDLLRSARVLAVPLGFMAVFAVWLLASVMVNVFRFGAQWSDVFAILRLFYFSAVMVFCVAFVTRFGLRPLLLAFVIGVALLTLGRLADAVTSDAPMVTGLPLLKDPNVIGNMLGIAVLMSSMLIFVGSARWAVTLSIFFAAASALTFSKGAWFMVMFGIGANVLALMMRGRYTMSGLKRTPVMAAACALAIVVLLGYNAERFAEMIALKVETTTVDNSMGLRFRYALGGAYAMIDNPVFGLGFRNYYVVERMYPELLLPASDNAHNVFSQIAAVGGLPALLAFMLLFSYPFIQLWSLVRLRSATVVGASYVACAVLVFFLSGAVQLQIVAQPFFWVFTGLVKGWRSRSSS